MDISCVPIPVDTRAPTGRTNAYLVGAEEALLVDPADRYRELTALLDEQPPSHIAVTHTHRDHVGAVSHYTDRYDACLWALEGFADRFADATGRRPDRTFTAGDRVGPTTVLPTPGHARDHVAFELGTEAVVGDLAVAEGSVFVGGSDGDLVDYLDSLNRLLERDFTRLHPGHGSRIDDPPTTIQRLIHHRLDREKRVQSAVEAGYETVEEILEHAYDKDLSGVRDLAAMAIEAHLEKLAADGVIDWDGNEAGRR
jgi:glyoxylase-like metal-dependent hydrolase (beta-lactamase superfamily II)